MRVRIFEGSFISQLEQGDLPSCRWQSTFCVLISSRMKKSRKERTEGKRVSCCNKSDADALQTCGLFHVTLINKLARHHVIVEPVSCQWNPLIFTQPQPRRRRHWCHWRCEGSLQLLYFQECHGIFPSCGCGKTQVRSYQLSGQTKPIPWPVISRGWEYGNNESSFKFYNWSFKY